MPMMVASLASGSSGNVYYIECPDGAVLIDAGLNGTQVVENLLAAGGNPARVAGVIVTHDHSDHVKGAGILQRKYGWRLWMTGGTQDAAAVRLGKVRVERIAPGGGLKAGGMEFRFTATPHDGAEPVAVTVARGGRRCGVFTDLGHVFPGLGDELETLDFVFLEANYDPALLSGNRRYPYPLKMRIRGEGGHLSNRESADLLFGMRGERLKRVVLAHLSQENNTPELAKEVFASVLNDRIRGAGLRLGVAPRHTPMRLCAV